MKKFSSYIQETKNNFLEEAESFVEFACEWLELDTPPAIYLSNNKKHAIIQKSFGGYSPSDKDIRVNIAERHKVDVFRTLAHELVHYKQDLDGRLDEDSGQTGSEIENEANAVAGIIMREYARVTDGAIFEDNEIDAREEGFLVENLPSPKLYLNTSLYKKHLKNLRKLKRIYGNPVNGTSHDNSYDEHNSKLFYNDYTVSLTTNRIAPHGIIKTKYGELSESWFGKSKFTSPEAKKFFDKLPKGVDKKKAHIAFISHLDSLHADDLKPSPPKLTKTGKERRKRLRKDTIFTRASIHAALEDPDNKYFRKLPNSILRTTPTVPEYKKKSPKPSKAALKKWLASNQEDLEESKLIKIVHPSTK